jgi:hypothetical protein
LPSRKLRLLLPDTIANALSDNFEWNHDDIQRELDNLVVQEHDALYDLSRISDQQDKATLLSTDTSVFQLIPTSKVLQIPNEDIIYLAKQGTAQVYLQILTQCGSNHRKHLWSAFGLT